MADNTIINAGSGGDTLRTDDVGGGIKVPVSKIITGDDGIDGGFVTSTNPLPVVGITGSVFGLLHGGQAVNAANPLSTRPQSGSLTGLLVGGVALSSANPMPVTGAVGVLVGGVPATLGTPLPTQLSVAGAAINSANPLYTIANAEAAGLIASGSTTVAVYHSFGDFTTSGSVNQVVPPAGAGKRIAVLSAHLMAPSAVLVRWQSTGSAGTITNISGLMPLPANGGFVLPHNPHAWFKTAANEGLNLNLSSTVSCGVIITWTVFNS